MDNKSSRAGNIPLKDNCPISVLSIVVDDFDLSKQGKEDKETNCRQRNDVEKLESQNCIKKEIRTTDTSIKKILDEVEHRKDEFKKLIDEHSAVIENIKKMKAQEIDENKSNNNEINKSNDDKAVDHSIITRH